MTNTTASIGTESMAERSYRVLRDKLITLEIGPGDPINEAALATELDMGRTPVREALKRLELDHLVVSYPRRGTFATNVDITELASISEVRSALEPLAASRAAANRGGPYRANLVETRQAILDLDLSENRYGMIKYDLEVHRLIYKAAQNQHLEETLIRLDNLATRIWCMVLGRIPDIHRHITEHITLINLILDGDEARAAKFAGDHITEFEKAVRAIL